MATALDQSPSGGIMSNAFPIRPQPENDERFTIGLVADVRNVLKAHGYAVDDMSGRDFVELQMALYRLLYVERQS